MSRTEFGKPPLARIRPREVPAADSYLNYQMILLSQHHSTPLRIERSVIDVRGISLSFLVIVIFVIIFLVVMPLVISVIAGTGILFVVAGGTIVEVQIELLDHGFRIGGWLDLHNDGEVISLGKSDIRDQDITTFCQSHAGRIGSAAASDADGLLADRHGFSVFSESCDLDLTVFGHEELEMRLYFVKNLASIWSGFRMFMIMVVPFMFFMFVVLFVSLQGR